MRSPLPVKKALSNADPCLSEPGGIFIDDGPAHGETQAPLGVSDCSSARRCSVLQHGMAKLGVSSQQTRHAAVPTSCIRVSSGVNAFELIHVLVAGPSLFWKFSGNHKSEECMSHLFNLVAQYGPLNPQRDEAGRLVDPM